MATPTRRARDGIDAWGLAHTLRRDTSADVRFDAGSRALWSSDASIFRITPLGVVLPRSADDIAATVALCAEAGASVVPRGGGTSTSGQGCGPGVVLDCSRYFDHVVELDAAAHRVVVEPGTVLDTLQAASAAHQMRFGPDPSTHDRCTLGGMLGNNSCGSRALRWGKTDDNVEALDVLLADGSRLTLSTLGKTTGPAARVAELERGIARIVARYGDEIRAAIRDPLPRRVSGYPLWNLLPENGGRLAASLVGTEGTCAVILGATLRLVDVLPGRALLVLGFPDVYTAADAVPAVLPSDPVTIEGIDRRLLALARRPGDAPVPLPEGDAFLLLEVDGEDDAAAAARANDIATHIAGRARAHVLVVTDRAAQRAIWKIREDGAGLATRLASGKEAWPGFEDAAVPPARLGEYLRRFDELVAHHGYEGLHYGHYGEGCMHVRIDFDLLSTPGIAGYRRFMEDAADLVISFGGSLSGEHGDGQAKGELLSRMYSPTMLEAFAAYKALFDPNETLNPGRGVRPRALDRDIRAFDLLPAEPFHSHLALGNDGHDLAASLRRCVGVGKCRRLDEGAMCPSFQVTRDEMHSTRGRAHLFGEVLSGKVVPGGFKSDELGKALDLCLACKACKVECPVGVDMATYKVEFLSRRYRHRLRPRAHYALGWLPVALRVGSLAPSLVNRLQRGPLTGRLLRLAGGLGLGRPLPELAPRRAWRRRPTPAHADAVRFSDCFTRFLEPEVADAADSVLDALGTSVDVVAGATCCGLTLYSTGQLGPARTTLRRTLRRLGRAAGGKGPIVVLEPSCAAMLRDETEALLPGDESAAAVACRVVSLAEAIDPEALRAVADSDEAVTAQVHCHQQAGRGFEAELALLEAIGATVHHVETACCGLAGDFGVTRGHEEISAAIARHNIVGKLATTDASDTVLADGVSCRTQIRGLTARTPRHLAQVLAAALSPSRATTASN